MLKRHLDHLLIYLKYHITNAVTEGLNSKIQSLKSAARGFRSFRNYRIRIMFFRGKLNLYPGGFLLFLAALVNSTPLCLHPHSSILISHPNTTQYVHGSLAVSRTPS